jgi:excisionase family DNA binding protein
MMVSNLMQKPITAIADADPLLTRAEVCRQLGCSERTAYRAIAKGKFPKPSNLPGVQRWFQSEINEYIRESRKCR